MMSKKVFSLKKYLESMVRHGLTDEVVSVLMNPMCQWPIEIEGKEVKDNRVGPYIVNESWIKEVKDDENNAILLLLIECKSYYINRIDSIKRLKYITNTDKELLKIFETTLELIEKEIKQYDVDEH